jgi:hypothetical protein
VVSNYHRSPRCVFVQPHMRRSVRRPALPSLTSLNLPRAKCEAPAGWGGRTPVKNQLSRSALRPISVRIRLGTAHCIRHPQLSLASDNSRPRRSRARKSRARSSAGTRRSRTASCWKTISYPVISKPRSKPTSLTTITAVTMRASITSPRPTSTSDAAQPFWQNAKGSNDRPLPTVACSTSCTPPDFTNPMS